MKTLQNNNEKISNLPNSTLERALTIVDLENLAGGADKVGRTSSALRTLVRSQQSRCSNMMTVVSTGIKAVRLHPDVLWDWKPARFLIGRGLDGADKELLNVLENDPVASTATYVQIWSGDHCFAPVARLLRARGCHVHVFCRSGSLSRELKHAANEVTIISPVLHSLAWMRRGQEDQLSKAS